MKDYIMNITGSIQARMGSSRLPGKVLKGIGGKPLLLWQVERIRRSKLLDDVIVATTVNKLDDEIVEVCKTNNIKYFRGSEDDVLGRIASLIREFNIDTHVEFFGDSPLTDPHLIDEMIGMYLKYKPNYDYITNSIKTSFPPGQEISVCNAALFLEVDEKIQKNDPLREHVSLHITKHPKKYNIKNIEAPSWYYYPDIYLEVDTPLDFELISSIISYFTEKGYEHFSLAQILDYLNMEENQALKTINQSVHRRWKEFRKED